MLWELAQRRLLEQRQDGSKHSLVIYIDDNSRKESFCLGISTAAHMYRNEINPLCVKIILPLQQKQINKTQAWIFALYQVTARNQVKSDILN